MTTTHRARVESMLAAASAQHAALLPQLPPELQVSLPVDAQGITEAIDFLAEAAGLSSAQRRTLGRPHAVSEVRALLVEHPLPLAHEGLTGVPALREAYEAQERAVMAIATRLDDISDG